MCRRRLSHSGGGLSVGQTPSGSLTRRCPTSLAEASFLASTTSSAPPYSRSSQQTRRSTHRSERLSCVWAGKAPASSEAGKSSGSYTISTFTLEAEIVQHHIAGMLKIQRSHTDIDAVRPSGPLSSLASLRTLWAPVVPIRAARLRGGMQTKCTRTHGAFGSSRGTLRRMMVAGSFL